ncbi:hypothetical protein, partial [Pseudobacteriovorax antillogorgiicola]
IRELKTTSQGVSPRSFEDHTPFLGIRQTEPSRNSNRRTIIRIEEKDLSASNTGFFTAFGMTSNVRVKYLCIVQVLPTRDTNS